MENTVVLALGITVVGMSLLFLTLVLFYGLLTLLTNALQDREREPVSTAAGKSKAPDADEALLQAAALAVALARAELEWNAAPGRSSERYEISKGQQVSSWWALHHQRQLTLDAEARRTR